MQGSEGAFRFRSDSPGAFDFYIRRYRRPQYENPPAEVRDTAGIYQGIRSGQVPYQREYAGHRRIRQLQGSYNSKIDGQTYAALAKRGLQLWAGSYAGSRWDFEPGMAFTVKVNVRDIYNGAGRIPGQNYIDFECRTTTGRSYVFQGVGYYNRELMGTYQGAIPDKSFPNGSIIMYNGLGKRYTANQYIKVSAHEFGHVLGLGDQYGKSAPTTAECPGGTKYVKGDIMGAHGNVTANNIEMFLEAYRTNRYQAYVNSGPEVKSRVIRSY